MEKRRARKVEGVGIRAVCPIINVQGSVRSAGDWGAAGRCSVDDASPLSMRMRRSRSIRAVGTASQIQTALDASAVNANSMAAAPSSYLRLAPDFSD